MDSLGKGRPAPAVFIGHQETVRGGRLALYTLTADVPGHPKGSTLSGQTLRELGYELTDPPSCPHPPRRLYAWRADDGTTCVGCCQCGAILAGAA